MSFGLSNQMVVTFKEENLMAFQHLFLKDYADGGTETFALYKQADVYDHIEYIITQVRESFCVVGTESTPNFVFLCIISLF